MILVDVSMIIKSAISAIMNAPDAPPEVEPGMIRHTFLDSLRKVRTQHKAAFGEVVLCVDSFSGKSWRKNHFQYYKARRSLRYEDSKIDWKAANPIIQMVLEELRDDFPYKFVMVPTCEADDVIGVICRELGDSNVEWPNTAEPILIVSSDKDFLQLQKFTNVKQYSNVMEKFMHVDDPVQYLHEKILTGDSGDDVPNVRSQDDFFMGENGRQKPITKGIKADFDAYKATDPDAERRYARNKLMIDLNEVPQELADQILEQFAIPPNLLKRSKILTYLSKHRLRSLVERSNEF